MANVKHVMLPEAVLQKVMDYLSKQTYKDVNHLITAVQSTSQLLEVQIPEKEEVKEEETETDKSKPKSEDEAK